MNRLRCMTLIKPPAERKHGCYENRERHRSATTICSIWFVLHLLVAQALIRPGADAGRHSHPVVAIGLVLEGSMISSLQLKLQSKRELHDAIPGVTAGNGGHRGQLSEGTARDVKGFRRRGETW